MSDVLITVLNFRSWQVRERSSFNLFYGSEIVTVLSQSWHFRMEFYNKSLIIKQVVGFHFFSRFHLSPCTQAGVSQK